jgi:hypothetical protein
VCPACITPEEHQAIDEQMMELDDAVARELYDEGENSAENLNVVRIKPSWPRGWGTPCW